MSVSQILTTYDGQEPTLCITGGGGGNVNSVSGGPGLTITGGLNTPQVNLGFTAPNQLVYGTGNNAGAILGPGGNNDFLRINNSGNLEWHPISAGGVVSVSANPGGACFVNNSNASTPAVAIAFPAGAKGALPASDGTGANLGAFLPGPLADGSQQNYVLSADNMSAVGFSWKAAAGTAITGEAPLVEFVDGTLTKVGIDFAVGAGGIGQIPVGISNPTGKLGTLTPALTVADDGKVLTASSADAATGGVKWALPAAPGGTVLRVLTATQNIGAPTVNNETLTIIDTAPAGSGFVVNLLPNPAGLVNKILSISGAVPYRLTAGEEGYLVYGLLTDKTTGLGTGVIYKYVPNVATPANGVWTLRAITQGPASPATDVNASFEGACVLNPVIADGGRPPVDADYIFCGNFTTVADANGANPVASTQIIKYESATDTFVAQPLTSGPFTQGIDGVLGIPTALVGAIGTFLLVCRQPIVIASSPAVDYGLIAIYDGVGVIKTIGGAVGDQFDPVSDAAFDTSNRLWIGGAFEGYQTGGIIYTAKKLACLTAGASAFSTNVPLPYNFIRGDTIGSVQNSYDGALITISGQFSSTNTPAITNFGAITIGGGNDLQLNQITQTSGFPNGRCLLIDVNTYVVAIDTSLDGSGLGALYGSDSGTLATFAKGLVDTGNTALNWNYKAIAAGGNALNFIDFDFFYDTQTQPPLDESNAFSGYFDGSSGGGTVLTFIGGATVRYPKTSGAIGDATTATIQGAYSSISLIGDLPNNKWDLISTTGTVVFSP